MNEDLERVSKCILFKLDEMEIDILLRVGSHKIPDKKSEKVQLLFSILRQEMSDEKY